MSTLSRMSRTLNRFIIEKRLLLAESARISKQRLPFCPTPQLPVYDRAQLQLLHYHIRFSTMNRFRIFIPLSLVCLASLVFFSASDRYWASPPAAANTTKIPASTKSAVSTTDQPKSSVKCPGYHDLDGIDFWDPRIRRLLCLDLLAFKRDLRGRFPPCRLSPVLPFAKKVLENSVKTHMKNVMNETENIVIYGSRNDFITRNLLHTHQWKADLSRILLQLANRLPINSVTFVDIGCNIGTLALQAAAAGLPTVCVYANVANLVRVRAAAEEMGIARRIKLIWTLISHEIGIRRLHFDTSICNDGSAKLPEASESPNSQPVATSQADDLIGHIDTRHILLKVGIESSTPNFFYTAERLFHKFDIPVIAMEFSHKSLRSGVGRDIAIFDYLTSLNYSLRLVGDLKRKVNLREKFTDADTVWIKEGLINEIIQ